MKYYFLYRKPTQSSHEKKKHGKEKFMVEGGDKPLFTCEF